MQEVAKKDEIALINRGDKTTLQVYPGPELSSPYSGNIVDICPVGALTSQDFRFKKTRLVFAIGRFDLQWLQPGLQYSDALRIRPSLSLQTAL